MQIKLVILICGRLADVLGLLGHSLIVILLVVVVNRGQMVLLAVNLGQIHVDVDVVYADL